MKEGRKEEIINKLDYKKIDFIIPLFIFFIH